MTTYRKPPFDGIAECWPQTLSCLAGMVNKRDASATMKSLGVSSSIVVSTMKPILRRLEFPLRADMVFHVQLRQKSAR